MRKGEAKVLCCRFGLQHLYHCADEKDLEVTGNQDCKHGIFEAAEQKYGSAKIEYICFLQPAGLI